MQRWVFAAVLLCSSLAFAASEASAVTTESRGYFNTGPAPYADYYQLGDGQVTLTVVDRVVTPSAYEGDSATFDFRFRVGAQEYRVELASVGLPQDAPLLPALAGQPVFGGVALDILVHGNAPVGSWATTQALAAIAVWGRGRIYLGGQLVTDQAFVTVMALSLGTHADDETHRLLPEARPGDHELLVLATHLPTDVIPKGFLQFEFERVQITLRGEGLPEEPLLPNVTPRLPEEVGVSLLSRRAATQYPGIGASAPTSAAPAVEIAPTVAVIEPLGAAPAAPLVPTVLPANTAAAAAIPQAVEPANAAPATALPTTESPSNAAPATALPTTVPPGNAAPATPLPATTPPANAAPATPLITTPPPLNAAPVP